MVKKLLLNSLTQTELLPKHSCYLLWVLVLVDLEVLDSLAIHLNLKDANWLLVRGHGVVTKLDMLTTIGSQPMLLRPPLVSKPPRSGHLIPVMIVSIRHLSTHLLVGIEALGCHVVASFVGRTTWLEVLLRNTVLLEEIVNNFLYSLVLEFDRWFMLPLWYPCEVLWPRDDVRFSK